MSARWFFPSRADRRRIDDLLTTYLDGAQERVVHGSVVPTFDVAQFRRELAEFDFTGKPPFDETLFWTITQLEHGLVHVDHPRYFGLFNPTPTFPAQCADRIAATFNPQLATWTTSPAAVEIESHVIRAVAERVGLPPGSSGHFTTGGAEANYTATLLALSKLCPDFASHGARAFAGTPVFYVSRESHLAWIKIAQQAGIGRAAVRLVETDGSGRLDADSLQETIRRDLKHGHVPFMVAATAGTTNAGMIDPLVRCAEIARVFGLWYHVDAAWGGGLIASDRLRAPLTGIEQADSVTIDAHKWFATTMGCGMLLTRWPDLLNVVFGVSTNYMPSELAKLDPYVNSVQWSRRFAGLRLFLSLAAGGWDGYAAHVEHSLALADLLKHQLTRHGWAVVNQSPVGVVCFIPPQSGAIPAIVNRVIASGSAWVSLAALERREVIRACVTSGTTTTDDIAVLIAALMLAASTKL